MAEPPDRDLTRRVGRRIAELRVQSGLTQDALAPALGMATKNLQRLESGSQNLTLQSLAAAARALGVDPLSRLCRLAPRPPTSPHRHLGVHRPAPRHIEARAASHGG